MSPVIRNRTLKNQGRRLGVALLTSLVIFTAAAEDIVLDVQPAEVSITGPGSFQLAFPIERAGNTSDGVRVLVETVAGGDNPAVPGQDYTPLPAGTGVLLEPGQSTASVNVEVFGDHMVPGMDKTLLLHLNSARVYDSQPHLNPAASHFLNCCFARDMVMVDVNGDGHLDIVTGNDQSWDVSVLLGDGDGGFGPALKLATGHPDLGRFRVAAGDVTGNGHVDILSTGFRSQEILVFEGDGTGDFAAAETLSAGTGMFPSDVAVADVNGNGHLDIVTSNGDNNSVSVLLSDGQGDFMDTVTFPTGAYPSAVTVADATGNGHVDILTANRVSGDLSVLEGNGSGQFAAPQHYSAGDEPQEVVVLDVTGNGHADIVTANRPSPGRGLGGGSAGSVSVLEGDGAGGFAAAQEFPLDEDSGRAESVAVADVTGSGHLDIVVTQPTNNTVSMFPGDGAGGFADPVVVPTGYGPNSLAIADVTGNGHLDVIVVNSVGENIAVLPGDGTGNLGYPGNHGVGEYPHSVVLVDFNGDGHLDIATANMADNDVSVLLADGQGGFAEARYPVADSPSWIVAGDINGNGIQDLATANLGGGNVSVLHGDGQGGFSEAVHFSVAEGFHSPYALALGDINGNGYLDIATANTNIQNDSASVLLNDGQGGFGTPLMLTFDTGLFSPQGVALYDATGNGHLDVLTANSFSGTIALWEGSGNGDFAPIQHLPTGEGPVIVTAADVTGNGHADLITLNHTAQSISVLAGDGSGGYAAAQDFPIFVPDGDSCTINPIGCPWPWGMVVADVTGNGHLDIVTANTDSDTVAVMVNDGAGDFSSIFHFDTGAHPGSVVVGDVTGDGNADVVTANRQTNNVSVLSSTLNRVVLLDDEVVGTLIADVPVPAPVQFESTLLPQLDPGDGSGFQPLETRPVAINNARVVTGHTSSRHGFVWSPEEGGTLLQPLFSEHASTASGVAINTAGDIAGGFNAPGSSLPQSYIFTSDGQFTALPLYNPGLYTQAEDMNDAGIVVGSAEAEPGGPFGGPTTSVYWVDGELHEVGRLDGFLSSASAINNHNVIVGHASAHELDDITPYRWTEEDGMVLLPQLVEGENSTSNDINDQGIVVGLGVLIPFESSRAVYWDTQGEIHVLSDLNEQVISSEAMAINNQGYIVGKELAGDGGLGRGLEVSLSEAVLWIDGVAYRLQDLVTDLPEDYWITEAVDINDDGDIIAFGLFPEEDEYTAILLTVIVKDDDLFSDRFEQQ